MDPVLAPSAVPAGSPPAPGTSAVPAPPADGSAAAPPVASPDNTGFRQLREQYETTKGKLEPWEKLGKYDDVAPRYELAARMQSEAAELAEQLGYDKAEVDHLFREDPVRLLAHLRQKAESAQPATLNPQEIKKQLDRLVEERLKPVTEREENRLISEAEGRFTGEFDRLMKTEFKDGLPDACTAAIRELAEAAMGNDPEAMKRLKYGQQTSDVARYFNDAKTRFLKVVTEYARHEQARIGNAPPNPAGTPPAKPGSRMDAKLSNGLSVKDLWNV